MATFGVYLLTDIKQFDEVKQLAGWEPGGCDTPYVVLYHANCIDGFTAAWACCVELIYNRKIKGRNITIVPVTYGDPILPLLTDNVDRLYIVDFSVPAYILDALNDRHIRTTVIDHHFTAAKMYGLSGNRPESKDVHCADVIYNPDESGASLVWKFFMQEETYVPRLIEHVRARDLWRKQEHTDAIHEALMVEEKSLSNWARLCYELEERGQKAKKLIEAGELTLKYKAKLVSEIAKQAIKVELLGVQGYATNCPHSLASDVGEAICKMRPETLYAAMFEFVPTEDKKGVARINWSLRSRGGYDVSRLASRFGGGGHKAAAGFTSTPALLTEAISFNTKAAKAAKAVGGSK